MMRVFFLRVFVQLQSNGFPIIIMQKRACRFKAAGK